MKRYSPWDELVDTRDYRPKNWAPGFPVHPDAPVVNGRVGPSGIRAIGSDGCEVEAVRVRLGDGRRVWVAFNELVVARFLQTKDRITLQLGRLQPEAADGEPYAQGCLVDVDAPVTHFVGTMGPWHGYMVNASSPAGNAFMMARHTDRPPPEGTPVLLSGIASTSSIAMPGLKLRLGSVTPVTKVPELAHLGNDDLLFASAISADGWTGRLDELARMAMAAAS